MSILSPLKFRGLKPSQFSHPKWGVRFASSRANLINDLAHSDSGLDKK